MSDSIKSWRSSCLKKARYPSQERAEKCLVQAKLERGVELRTYYCSICSGFHLTKQLDYVKKDKV